MVGEIAEDDGANEEVLFDIVDDDADDDDDVLVVEDDDSAWIEGGPEVSADAEVALEVAAPDHDCLVVLSDGINPAFVVAECIRRAGTRPTDLVLLFNVNDDVVADDIRGALRPSLVMSRMASSAIPASSRQRLYIAGRVVAMSLATASLDMINGVLPANLVKGVVILDAHCVVPGSKEALVLRLLRDKCRPFPHRPFIKLITCNAAAFEGGSRLEHVVACSRVQHVHLWPRFRTRLDAAVARTPIDSVGVFVQLSRQQEQLHNAIKVVVRVALSELITSAKRYLANEDVADVTEDDDVFSADIERRLRRQLQKRWHLVGPKTKQLLNDVSLLRKLFVLLVQLDCVSFYRFLLSIRGTERPQHSQWLLTDQADRLFQLAKRRIYSVANNQLRVALQPNPKWSILRQILGEIESEELPCSGPILVICADQAACLTASEILETGDQAFLQRRWLQFLKSMRLDAVSTATERDDEEEASEDAFAARRRERALLRQEYLKLGQPGPRQATLARFGVKSASSSTKSLPQRNPPTRTRKRAKVSKPPAPPVAEPSPNSSVPSLQSIVKRSAQSKAVEVLEEQRGISIMFWAKGSGCIPLDTINVRPHCVFHEVQH